MSLLVFIFDEDPNTVNSGKLPLNTGVSVEASDVTDSIRQREHEYPIKIKAFVYFIPPKFCCISQKDGMRYASNEMMA